MLSIDIVPERVSVMQNMTKELKQQYCRSNISALIFQQEHFSSNILEAIFQQ